MAYSCAKRREARSRVRRVGWEVKEREGRGRGELLASRTRLLVTLVKIAQVERSEGRKTSQVKVWIMGNLLHKDLKERVQNMDTLS